jgi:hypothetical protein
MKDWTIYKVLITTLIVGGVLFAIYDSFTSSRDFQERLRIADSLQNEVLKYRAKYDSLVRVGRGMDSVIASQRRELDSLKRNPPDPVKPEPPTPKPKDVKSALQVFDSVK